MLPVLEASAGEQNGQIGVIVGIGVSQIAAEEHHGAVKESLIRFAMLGETAEYFGEERHLLLVGVLELADFFDGLTVVAQVMISVRRILVRVQLEDGGGEGVDHQGHNPGRIRLERELGHREHQVELGEEELAVRDVGRHRPVGRWLGAQFPFTGGTQAGFHFADGSQVLVETSTVCAVEIAGVALGVVEQRVEDTAAFFESVELASDFGGIAL